MVGAPFSDVYTEIIQCYELIRVYGNHVGYTGVPDWNITKLVIDFFMDNKTNCAFSVT